MISEITLERPLPSNLDAERCILGAILLNNDHLNAAIEKLEPKDFFLEAHQRIFECMTGPSGPRPGIDLVTLAEDLARRGKLEAAGGVAYLAQLPDGVPRAANIEHYARIVKEKALLRNLVYAAHSIQQHALDGDEEAEVILDQAEAEIFKLADGRLRTGLIGVKELVQENFARIEKMFSEGRRITGLATGYHGLDNDLAGLQKSELIILAARPSIGKTALALNIAENVAVRLRQAVAVFSLEMSKESLLLRLLSSHAEVDSHKFRTGHVGRDDWERITRSLSDLGEAPLWIDDSAAATVMEIGAKLRRLPERPALVIVDYLQLLAARGRFGNRNEEVSSISRGLKALAKELQVPMLVLSQLTRAPEREERRPQLADLRESGAIEQDADVVLFIHREAVYKKGSTEDERAKAELIIAKQRNGPTNVLPFAFIGKRTRFEERADNWQPAQTA